MMWLALPADAMRVVDGGRRELVVGVMYAVAGTVRKLQEDSRGIRRHRRVQH